MAEIRIVVRPLHLAQHELEVELHLPAEAVAKGAVAALPAWTPGSYLIRDYARFLDRVELRDAAGKPLPAPKLDKQRWSLPPLKKGGTLRYRLFANDLSVRTNHVDSTHAFLTGAASFLYLENQLERPLTVRFEGFPEDWKIATGLPLQGGVFFARDYDTLVDSPFELGTFRLHRWTSLGVEFEFAFTGEHNGDEARIVAGTKQLVEEAGKLFNGFPFERYLFLLTFSPKAGGGLEHRNSTALLGDPHRFDKVDGYHHLFGLISHEFFHVWNVKRLHDPVLGPFDYSKETPTRLLWFHEGFTDYMDSVLALRAGVLPWAFAANEWAQRWTENMQRPGRLEQSVAEASWDAWIRHYKANEFTPNSTVGYYDKGSLVALMMEGRLRLGSGGRHGVADLFALLWKRHGERGLVDGDIRAAYTELGGQEEAAFWMDFIDGRTELDARGIEQAFGLTFEAKSPGESPAEPKDPLPAARARGWTGLVFSSPGPAGDPAIVQNVIPGSPAFRAGLSYGQEIVAVAGWRTATGTEVQNRLADGAIGGALEVVSTDRGRLRTTLLTIEENPSRSIRIKPAAKVTELQKASFRTWTGLAHPESSASPKARKKASK
jgi:predicted metalloprotease with PDZ domain